jgi:SAM-dependent methyltransferase
MHLMAPNAGRPLEWYLNHYEPGAVQGKSQRDVAQWNIRREIGRFIRALAPRAARLLEIGGFTGWHTLFYRDQIQEPQRAVIYDWQDFRTEKVREQTDFQIVDLETQALPASDGSFDVAVCNQVFEHLKNIFQPITEIHRILKPGGILLISVPNLAALHNRLLLCAGRQPSTTAIMGSHVRGYTLRSFSDFLTLNGHFRLRGLVGVACPPFTSRRLPGFLRSLCHTPVWALEKTASSAPLWTEVMKRKGSSTNFFPDQDVPTKPATEGG